MTPLERAARIYWGEDQVRRGWFIELGDQTLWIHGPSICSSSGGGALRALEQACDKHGLDPHTVYVTIPVHEDVEGKPCGECRALLAAALAET
jgi:hypothetical protein